MVRNEKGVALLIVLVLSVISLAIIATVVILVTQGTRFSGFNKRYETAREAALGGAEINTALLANQGNLIIPPAGGFSGVNFPDTCTCSPVNPFDIDNIPLPDPDTCLCEKICLPAHKSDGTFNWPKCDLDSIEFTDPAKTAVSPDIPFSLPGFGGTQYLVYGKIVDTSVGSTGSNNQDNDTCGGVVNSNCEPPQTQPMPYLYRIEITAQDAQWEKNPTLKERARLSVLFAR